MQTKQSKGGEARKKSLSAEQRSDIAKKAAQSRWNDDLPAEHKKLPQALYIDKLMIGDVEINCAVLSDKGNTRVISANSIFQAFGRMPRGLSQKDRENQLPPFLASATLKTLIDSHFQGMMQPITFRDGKQVFSWYRAELLPEICSLYLKARREKILNHQMYHLAEKAEILLDSFAKVGIIALIDEATGFQRDRKNDALRYLLLQYIEEGIQKWIKTFPDAFFTELDRLYNNETTISRKRPIYYGTFINQHIYAPIEHGYVKKELNKLNITDEGKRKARFHQWLTEHGRNVLLVQIGRVQGLMEISPSIESFKSKMRKQKEISIAPYLFEEMNRIDD